MKEATLKVDQSKKILILIKADSSLWDICLFGAISLYRAPPTGLVGYEWEEQLMN